MNKKSLALILSMAMFFSCTSPAFAEESQSDNEQVVAIEETENDSTVSNSSVSSDSRSKNEFYGSKTVSAAELSKIVANGSAITISSCEALPYVGKRIKYGNDVNMTFTVSNGSYSTTFSGLDVRLSARTHNDSISTATESDKIKAQITRISISRKDLRTAFRDKAVLKKVTKDILLVSRALRHEDVLYEITEYPAQVSGNKIYSAKKYASKTGDLVVKVKKGNISKIQLVMVTTKNHSGKKRVSVYNLKPNVDYELKSGNKVIFKGGHVTSNGAEITILPNN